MEFSYCTLQVYQLTGIERAALTNVILTLAGYYLVGGLGPWSPTFSPENLLVVTRAICTSPGSL